MESTLEDIAQVVAKCMELLAIAVIAVGALEAVIGIARLGLRHGESAPLAQRAIWTRFARWVVGGMTFQLASDVVTTSFAVTWEEVGHLAAIAALRTLLSFFLDREMEAKSASMERAPGA